MAIKACHAPLHYAFRLNSGVRPQEITMHRLTTAAALCLCAFAALAGNPTQVCEEAKEFGAITKQLPGYTIPSVLHTQAHLISKDRLNGYALLKAARDSHVCIASVLDDAGAVQHAAAFYLKRIALSK